jgi:hypothetical protein
MTPDIQDIWNEARGIAALEAELGELRRQLAIQSTTAPGGLTCSACGFGCNAVHSGRCVTCWAAEAGSLQLVVDGLRGQRDKLEAALRDISPCLKCNECHAKARAALGKEATR